MTIYERAEKWAQMYPGAVSGQGGSSATFRLCGVLSIGFDLNDEEVFGILSQWNRKCTPPWTEDELAHKLDSVKMHPSNKKRGWMLREAKFPVKAPLVYKAPPVKKLEPIVKLKKAVFEPETLKRIASRVVFSHVDSYAEVVGIVDEDKCWRILPTWFTELSDPEAELEEQGRICWQVETPDDDQDENDMRIPWTICSSLEQAYEVMNALNALYDPEGNPIQPV